MRFFKLCKTKPVLFPACLVLWAATLQGESSARVEVAMGYGHGVLLKSDGTLWDWGSNDAGQLGREGDDLWTPAPVPGMSGILRVAAGYDFTMALKPDGTVWAWGGNHDGQLGNASKQDSPVPAAIGGLPPIMAIAAGIKDAIALDANGTVWVWGEYNGPKPKQVSNLPNIIAIAAGDKHGVALDSNGHVWVWGDHGISNLDGGFSGPRQVPGFSDIQAVAAGYQFTYGLRKDGTVWSAGSDDGSLSGPVPGLSGVKAIGAGYRNALALKADGTVWGWGDNRYKQLGNPAITSDSSTKPVRVGTLTGVIAIASAGYHSAAVTNQGSVWTWGKNESGVLGADPQNLERSDVPMRPGQPIPVKCEPGRDDGVQQEVFGCETAKGKWIRLCGTPDQDDSDKWTNINYRFGPEYGPPELMFPPHPESAPPSLFYSADKDGSREVVRFSNGGYTYRLYYGFENVYIGEGKERQLAMRPAVFGGEEVQDANGKKLSEFVCQPQPHIDADLSRNLPYDPQKAGEQWTMIKNSPDPEDFDRFASMFPPSDLTRLAETRAAQLRSNAAAPKGKTRLNPKDGLTYVWIPSGKFQMGCSPRDSQCLEDETPAHSVTITKGFWIGLTEVTQEAYQRVTGQNRSRLLGDRLPVEVVDWNEAKAYCEATGMRLPTEAEWEYAARGGNPSARYGDLDSIAWYRKDSSERIHEVGLKKPNGFGLYDMLGNLWEWTNDLYGPYSSAASPDPRGPSSGVERVARGGSWDEAPRVSERLKYAPGNRVDILGFRCAGD